MPKQLKTEIPIKNKKKNTKQTKNIKKCIVCIVVSKVVVKPILYQS